MKTIKVKPIEEIEFVFKDKTWLCSFNMLAMAYMQETISELDGRLDEISTAHLVSMMLYAGIKSNDDSFTMEQAKALAMQLDPSCFADIIDSYEKAVSGNLNAEELAQVKKMMAQYLASVRK